MITLTSEVPLSVRSAKSTASNQGARHRAGKARQPAGQAVLHRPARERGGDPALLRAARSAPSTHPGADASVSRPSPPPRARRRPGRWRPGPRFPRRPAHRVHPDAGHHADGEPVRASTPARPRRRSRHRRPRRRRPRRRRRLRRSSRAARAAFLLRRAAGYGQRGDLRPRSAHAAHKEWDFDTRDG